MVKRNYMYLITDLSTKEKIYCNKYELYQNQENSKICLIIDGKKTKIWFFDVKTKKNIKLEHKVSKIDMESCYVSF